MRTTFSNSGLAHVWASQSQSEGRSNSMRFAGPSLYSYRTEIGRIIDLPDGSKAALVNIASFSTTTSTKHKPAMHRAIRHMQTIAIEKPGRGSCLPRTAAEAADLIYHRGGLAAPERLPKETDLKYFNRLLDWEAEREAALRTLRKLISPLANDVKAALAAAFPEIERARQFLAAREARLEKSRAKREEYRNVSALNFFLAMDDHDLAWANVDRVESRIGLLRESHPSLCEQAEAKLKAAKEIIANALKDKIAKWRRGEIWNYSGSLFKLPGALLRINREPDGSEVVFTSLGARVPVKAAIRAWKFASKRRASGWKRNGETCRVGHYQLDEITPEFIKAGCHTIQWIEVDALAEAEGWGNPPQSTEPVNIQPPAWDVVENSLTPEQA